MKATDLSPKVYKKLQTLKNKDPKFYQKIIKQLDLFEKNPRHGSLRLHKIKKNTESVWSISIDRGFRMLFLENDDTIYFFEIGTHDEVYRDN